MKKILLVIMMIFFVACGSGVTKRGSYNELENKVEEKNKERTEEIYKNIREEEVTKMPPIEDFFPEKKEEENKNTSSLWSPERKSLYADSKASKKGDIVFVVVNEEVTAEINYNLEKSGYTDYTSQDGVRVQPKIVNTDDKDTSVRGDIRKEKTDTEEKTDLVAEGETEGAIIPDSDGYNGEGSSKRNLVFDGKITARVEGMDKYGNLYIKGSKLALVNNESVLLEVSGYVRSRDIKTDNTVSSENIDNLEFTYNGAMYLGKPILKEFGSNEQLLDKTDTKENEKEKEVKKKKSFFGLF